MQDCCVQEKYWPLAPAARPAARPPGCAPAPEAARNFASAAAPATAYTRGNGTSPTSRLASNLPMCGSTSQLRSKCVYIHCKADSYTAQKKKCFATHPRQSQHSIFTTPPQLGLWRQIAFQRKTSVQLDGVLWERACRRGGGCTVSSSTCTGNCLPPWHGLRATARAAADTNTERYQMKTEKAKSTPVQRGCASDNRRKCYLPFLPVSAVYQGGRLTCQRNIISGGE